MKQKTSLLPQTLGLFTLIGGMTAAPSMAQTTTDANSVMATVQNGQQTTATPDHSGNNLLSARKINATTIE